MNNGWMYFKYSNLATNDRLTRFTVDRQTWAASKDSALVIFELPYVGQNHHGAPPIFINGQLMMPNGDGVTFSENNKPQNPAIDPNDLMGKIIRVNVDASTPETPYTIPADNPVIPGGFRPEIWAYGFRNPWTWSYDEVTGHIFVGSVGQDMYESLYVPQAGKFHGWHTREGYNCYYPNISTVATPYLDCATPDEVLPIFEFPHDPEYCPVQSNPAHCEFPYVVGNSIVAGYVYRGHNNPAIHGTFIFTISEPAYRAQTYAIVFDPLNPANIDTIYRFDTTYPAGFVLDQYYPPTLGKDSRGEILLVDINNPNGMMRFQPDAGVTPIAPFAPAQLPPATAPPGATPVAPGTAPSATPFSPVLANVPDSIPAGNASTLSISSAMLLAIGLLFILNFVF